MSLKFHLYTKLYCAKRCKNRIHYEIYSAICCKKVSILKGSIFSDNVEKGKRTTHKKQFGAITQ